MMIVNERPISAVAAAIAWIVMLHLWQGAASEPQRTAIDASAATHVGPASALPRTVAANYMAHR